MENHHHHHHAEPRNTPQNGTENNVRLAFQATWHCLIGCGIGEVLGMVIATALGWGNVPSILFAVALGFLFGFILGMRPLLRAGFPFKNAFKTVLIAEGLSIAVMEGFEVLTEVFTPGVMSAHLNEPIFWFGMLLALAVGFVAAFPVNLYFIKKGIRHQH